MRCRCCTDAASQHEQIQGTAVWRVGWVHAHTSSGGGGHSGTSKLSSSCIVALFLRYRAAWDNKHVCVCVLRDILNIILNTGNCTSVLIRCSITRGPSDASVLKLGRRDARAREARAADPRAPVEAETRVTGRPAAPARYALSFMFPRILRALRTQPSVDCASSLSSLFQERGLPRNYRVAYARCSCEVSHDSSRRGSIGLRSLAAETGAADKRGSFASLSVGTRWLCSACN